MSKAFDTIKAGLEDALAYAERDNFTRRFNSCISDRRDTELAILLDTTENTIRRWKEGRNIPTRSVREAVFRIL